VCQEQLAGRFATEKISVPEWLQSEAGGNLLFLSLAWEKNVRIGFKDRSRIMPSQQKVNPIRQKDAQHSNAALLFKWLGLKTQRVDEDEDTAQGGVKKDKRTDWRSRLVWNIVNCFVNSTQHGSLNTFADLLEVDSRKFHSWYNNYTQHKLRPTKDLCEEVEASTLTYVLRYAAMTEVGTTAMTAAGINATTAANTIATTAAGTTATMNTGTTASEKVDVELPSAQPLHRLQTDRGEVAIYSVGTAIGPEWTFKPHHGNQQGETWSVQLRNNLRGRHIFVSETAGTLVNRCFE